MNIEPREIANKLLFVLETKFSIYESLFGKEDFIEKRNIMVPKLSINTKKKN